MMRNWQREIILWFATGERGLSSEAIALASLLGEARRSEHPHDPADLRRCLLLLKRAPRARDGLELLAGETLAWKRLVDGWEDLASLLRQEIGEDLPSWDWRAPRTYSAMKQALGREALS